MNKITIVGAGNVGATLGMFVAQEELADVVLVDIQKDMAQAKALDIQDALSVLGKDCQVIGTDNYELAGGSQVVVVTAGIPRKPGMLRKDLVSTNAAIVTSVVKNLTKHAPEAIVIMVTNPLDVMTYLAQKTGGYDRKKIMGMAGVLDGARMTNQISKTFDVSVRSIRTLVLGSHGNEMVPVFSHTVVDSKKLVGDFLKPSAETTGRLAAIEEAARNRGAQIVSLLGKGSAFYAPSASALTMVRAILNDTKETVAASVCLSGEYGISDICIGVPISLGKAGIESIVKIELDSGEKESLVRASNAIKEMIEQIKE
ncbi:MAG: malate dehydrogenase [Candidatus Omnitrophota bacterium]